MLIQIKKSRSSTREFEPVNVEYFSDVPRRDRANSRSEGGQINSKNKSV